MDRFFCCFSKVKLRADKAKRRRRWLGCGSGLLVLLTLAAGNAAVSRAQPVFFSMLFPQLTPGVVWESAPLENEQRGNLWEALFGKAVWL